MGRSRSRSPVRDRRRDRSRSRSPARDRRVEDRDGRRGREERDDRRPDYRMERGDRDRDRRDDRDRRPYDRRDDRYPPRDGGRRRDDDRRRDDRGGREERGREERGKEEDRGKREQEPEEGEQPERERDGGRSVLPSAEEEQPEAAPANGEAAKKKEPLSLEELLKKRKAEAEEQARPVFLTKEQRAKLALEKRAQEAAEMRERQAEMRAGLASSGLGPGAGPSGGGAGGNVGGRDGGRDGRGGGDRDRGYDRRDDRRGGHGDGRRDDRRGGRDDRQDGKGEDKEERERQRELELIKQQYLGAEKVKKKVLKATERMKFVFDWDAGEDTSRDLNPLYQNLHEANLLFGRGFRAGIDRREQKKTAIEAEADLLRLARKAAGTKETAEDRARDRSRRDYADKYEGADMRIEGHWSEKSLDEMTDRDWRIFREDFNIAYKGVNPTLPIRNWEEANLPKELMKAVERAGYKKPSPIQMAALPLGMRFQDVIGIAETGSGKTAAFVLPMLTYIMKQPHMLGNPEVEAEGPYSVILAPTRELAQQIEEETRNMAHFTDFRVVSVVGGQSIEEQGFALRKGCEIVVATPGRLVDCIERSYAVLNQCNYVVLDEADRMIDLGFEPQVMGVLDAMPSSNLKPENEDEPLESNRVYRTTYMFSATMPPAVERLARKYLRRPVVVTIGTAGKATDLVTQRVIMVKENEKPNALQQELAQYSDDQRIIVFANTKRQCDAVARQLENMDYRVTMLHGGKSQDQREESIKGFREDVYNVLVATDVAGRGIDVPNVALVVNYDMANAIEPYTHRIGRTGRAGKTGIAVTFLTLGDSEVFYDLKKFLEESKAAVPSQLAQHEASKNKPGTVGQGRPQIQFAKK
ncbi:DEAD-box ATP-dependent RNA helicase 21 [Micractinium conductrix]|uniref:DEAD-box ATP-dependent RNA helicase 21 n=1 Tax=Micractinium conductrix TaxID=554055 RepID=A0A2P6VJ41_9CHLO|nr:DEAD-box ATP-dependent RNA helicase 21 [Micractinium conductrix]|eukprot:PSC74094.1 DEAD-box ATP-dependent RNA helicase 21 [Micractinium conductrix]